MDKEITNIINQIHSNPEIKGSLVVTGCGSNSLSWLLSVAGASKTILTTYVPYSKKSLEVFLGKQLLNHVSEKESINIADKAYENSLDLIKPEDKISVFGLGCTGAISTNRIRKGEDKAYISIRSENSITSYSIFFDKERRDRTSEDIIISKQIINSIAYLHGIDYELPLELFDNEKLQRTHKIVK